MDKPNKRPNREVQRFGVPKTRDRVLEALSQAYINQQLETDDYENRVELAYKARTLDDLEEAIYDFPNRVQIMQRPKPMGGATDPESRRSVSNSGNFNFPFTTNTADSPMVTLIGDRRLSAEDFYEPSVQLIHGIGDLVIDLRSISDNQNLEINQFSLIGDTKILVPKGMTVRKRNFMCIIGEFRRRKRRDLSKFLGRLMGQPKSKYEEEEVEVQPTNSVLTIRGFKLIGDITIVDY